MPKGWRFDATTDALAALRAKVGVAGAYHAAADQAAASQD